MGEGPVVVDDGTRGGALAPRRRYTISERKRMREVLGTSNWIHFDQMRVFVNSLEPMVGSHRWDGRRSFVLLLSPSAMMNLW